MNERRNLNDIIPGDRQLVIVSAGSRQSPSLF